MGKKKKSQKTRLYSFIAGIGALFIAVLTAGFTGIVDKATDRWMSEPADSTYEVMIEPNADVFENTAAHYVFPGVQSPEELDNPPIDDSWKFGKVDGWARSQGRQDIGFTHVQIAITSKSLPVMLQGVEVKILEDLESQTGVTVSSPTGGPASVQIMAIDLKEGLLKYIAKDEYSGEHLAKVDSRGNFAYEVPTGKTELFTVAAAANGRSCSWIIKLYLLVDGKRVEKIIDDDGKPFITLDPRSVPQPSYRWLNGSWTS